MPFSRMSTKCDVGELSHRICDLKFLVYTKSVSDGYMKDQNGVEDQFSHATGFISSIQA